MANDCILFLWATTPLLDKAFDLIRVWHFDYVTTLTWVKPNWGLGFWWRGQTEHLLFGIRGKVKPFNMQVSNVIETAKPLGHSKKPEKAYQIIEGACITHLWQSDKWSYRILELFARKQRKIKAKGMEWVCLGNELTGNDIRTDLKQIVV